MTWPVTHPASSLTSQPTKRAVSCGVLARPPGLRSATRAQAASSAYPVLLGRVDAVDRDATSNEVRGQRRRQLAQGRFGCDVAQFGGQHSVVLPRGEEHDPASGACLVLGGELPHQEQRGAGVDGVGEVELRCGEFLERLPGPDRD